ncbi:MAG TPA: hypothetical protein VK787_03705, partial [Puia sp.]|nr:hypothetical protein [Puia sp.]
MINYHFHKKYLLRRSFIFFMTLFGFCNSSISQNVQFGFTAGAGISGVTKTNNIGVAFEQRNSVV